MTSISFRLVPIGALLLWLSGAQDLPGAPPGQAGRPPNMILIISDDQAYTDFGFMGNPAVHTPHLDRLADRSARFVNGYVPSSVCRPSLGTLLTGLYPHQHLIHFNHPPPGFAALTRTLEIDKGRFDALRAEADRLIRGVPTLPRILAEQGYRCLQTGKYWEGHWRNAGFTEGMTLAEPSGGTYGDLKLANGDLVAHGNGDHGLVIGRQTMQPIYDFIDDCEQTPFFVWYAPFLPHTPHNAPPEFVKLYQQRHVASHRIPYYASISQFDQTVGELLDFVERRGLSEKTIVVFVVDNGWEPDAERFVARRNEWEHTRRSKRSPFEHGVRTPLLFRWDGMSQPRTIPQLVSTIDVVPTLLAAAGVRLEGVPLPGSNLLPSATGTAELPRDRAVMGAIFPGDATALGEAARDVAYRWVRQSNYKLIVPHARPGRAPWNGYLREPAFFDLAADPTEQLNLIGDPRQAARIARLAAALDAWWPAPAR